MSSPDGISPDWTSPDESAQAEYDPTFIHSRREAVIIFCAWLVTMLWSVPYCYIHGYLGRFDPSDFSTVWGIPSWIFWGIAFPWFLANVFTTWFCFFYMKDDDLGSEPDSRGSENSPATNAADRANPAEGSR